MNSSSLIPRQGERNRVALPPGSGDALLLSRLAQTQRPLIVVTDTAAQAQRLVEELRFFSQHCRVHLFPDWETK